ncbi:sigma-70 family RNA polymerase sigma factor [Roseibium limicola]|uniref:Sigma-70 family RNA polymerase sigma factor n=1 Tax=Roseibium limicola TaxID=2816037 RepID=A0A939EQ29_9HYPH|nr:sigma-70 family RNA polymerase sigma factor [Roseibium limicola]MBO0346855.1 sigma-70 family RNA polymerase sigma factor [Roseibium limicola]
MSQTMDLVDLSDLLGLVAGQDKRAFKSLYSATSAKLFGITLRILKDRDLASEALQETYIKVWQNASRYDEGKSRPITWLVALARNTAIDSLRRREPARMGGDNDEDALERVADPQFGRVDPAHRQTLKGCLEELDEVQRRCVILAYCEGYSRAELGKATGKPEATVKTWLRRGLLRLKSCMDRE